MRRGYTLIELLAVIVILAIIAIITIPRFSGIIKKIELNSALESVNGYTKTITNQVSSNLLDSNPNNDINSGIYDAPLDKKYNIEVKGKIPSSGWIEVTKKGVFRYSVIIDEYVVSYDGENKTIVKGSDVKPKPTFETDSWKIVVNNVRNGDTYYYNIGDTKKLKFTNNIERTVRIANMSTPDECKREGFSQTACGFVIEFADKSSNSVKGENTNKGGWLESPVREYYNTTFYNLFPEDLKKGIIDTYVVSGHGANPGDDKNYETVDKIYDLTAKELFSYKDRWDSSTLNERFTDSNFTRTLDFYDEYNNGDNKVPNKPRTDGVDDPWNSWRLRTPNLNIGETDCFGHVYHDHVEWNMCRSGQSSYSSSPAFRLG